MTYRTLQGIAALALAASFPALVYLLAIHVMQAAMRIFGIPDFRYYAPCRWDQKGALQNSKWDP